MTITLATKFTIARIILIIPTIILYIIGAQNVCNETAFLAIMISTAILFSIVCFTDFIDGHIARSTNTVTDLGKFLDPVADKVIIVVMLFLLVFYHYGFDLVFNGNGLVISILSSIIISRELLIGVFRSIAASKKLVLAADIYGKIKTVFLDIGVAALIIAPLHVAIAWIGTIIFYIGAFFAVFSGFNYIIKNKQVLKDNKVEENK